MTKVRRPSMYLDGALPLVVVGGYAYQFVQSARTVSVIA
jgi:hypothetical protein